jgi:hypothetical protein
MGSLLNQFAKDPPGGRGTMPCIFEGRNLTARTPKPALGRSDS